MKFVNIWDLSNFKNLQYTNDINVLLELIKSGKILSIRIQDRFELGDKVNSTIEAVFAKKGVSVNFVSDDKPILISSNDLIPTYISIKFYQAHEREIKEAYYEYFATSTNNYISIPSFAYTPQLIDILIKKDVEWIDFYDIELTEDEIKKLKDNFINATVHNNGESIQVSSNIAIGNYSRKQIEKENHLFLSLQDLVNSNLDNVIYINNNSKISILNREKGFSEEDYYKVVKDLLEHLSKAGKHYVVEFDVDNRSVFKEVFNGKQFANVDLFIKNDLYNYPYEDYLEEEKRLDKLVEPIKSKNLSPLERYLAVYNIVKNFKPYKENTNQYEESRYIRYILDNEYMVCVGYAKLLEVLCEKVGIRTTDLSVGVDISYDKDVSTSETPVEYGGHARCMVSIDDDKYGVHGIYVADPTWDNNLAENRLNFALMTSAKTVTGKRMLFYDMYHPILDINTFDDFNKQVNYLFKRHLEEVNKTQSLFLYDYLSFQEQVRMKEDIVYRDKMISKVRIVMAYQKTIEALLSTITCELEVNKFYKELYECKTEKDFTNLLTNIGHYLLTRVNQPVSSETVIMASVNATAIIKGLSEEEKQAEYERTRKNLYDRELIQFPYQVEEPDALGWKTK